MSTLLTFSGAVDHDPAIDRWIDTRPDALAAIARRWFSRIRASGVGVRELMHDGCATACVHDAPFAYVGVYTAHVNVGFFQGASLPDPSGLLEGQGKRMRHVKLRPDGGTDPAALEELIAAAYADIVARSQACR